jgi:hypothetical protein
MKKNNIFPKKNKTGAYKYKKNISLRRRFSFNLEKVRSANVINLLFRKKINQ